MMELGLPPQAGNPSEGFRLLREILALAPNTKVIVLTGSNGRLHAVQAISMGAHDFHEKPFELEGLTFTVERAFRLHELQQEALRPHSTVDAAPFGAIVTRDPEMQRLIRTTERLAGTDASVMLLGESGTGKELFARALHELSSRNAQPFVAINCAAIPENLLESELFGYERGAFTGAVKQTPGKIELAHGGTLFLDEIGDLPPPLQPKLLRFLQHRIIERVGGRNGMPVDVRIVCATHRDLKQLIAEGRFREDIYYRLAEVVLAIPALRARPGDAALLAHTLVRRMSSEQRRGRKALAPDAIDAIEAHPWPGNVRELESVIRRAVILADTSTIRAIDLGLESYRG